MCVCLFGRDWDTVAPPGIFFLKKCLIHLGSGWDTSTSKWQNWGAWRTADVARGSGAAQARGRGFGCCFFFFLDVKCSTRVRGSGAIIGGSFFLRRKTMRE